MKSKTIENLAVLTSGGDAPGMNAAIRAIVRACSYYNINCYGIKEGYTGLIKGDIELLNARSVSNIIHKGGTYLKSSRCQEFRTKEGRVKAADSLKRLGINGLVVIGGDGSFTGAQLLYKEHKVNVVGIPATIDNDINGTDFTIGYDTALNTVLRAVDQIRDTATSHNRLFFVEVMGRNSGEIALNTGIAAGAQDIIIPEEDLDITALMDSLNKSKDSGKTSSIVIVAEGSLKNQTVFDLAEEVNQRAKNQGYDYEIRVSVLGHMQRGGSPSCSDRVLASSLGVASVEHLQKGYSNIMVGTKSGHITAVSLDIAIQKPVNQNHKAKLEIATIISV